MKNKKYNFKNKGFTLIELLAIIVILGVIAVITVPIILNIVRNAKKNTAINSANGFIDAIDKHFLTSSLSDEDTVLSGEYTVLNGSLSGNGLTGELIPVNGVKPGSGTLTYLDDILQSGCLVINGYEVRYSNDKFTSNGKGNCGSSVVNDEEPSSDERAYYTITYNANGGESSQSTQDVLEGSSVGTLPTAIRSGYAFLGWYDSDVDGNKIESGSIISENIILYAHWGQITSFAADSWETIVAALKANRNAYSLGSTKTVTMNLEGSNKDYVLRLANTSTPEVCGVSGYSKTACGVVIEFVTTIGTQYMNSTNTTTEGWSGSYIRSYLNTASGSIYSKLPDELKSVIITTEPIVSSSGKSSTGQSQTSPNTTGDKLYLLSTREVGFDLEHDNKSNINTDTRTLDYYSDCPSEYVSLSGNQQLESDSPLVCNKRYKYTTSAGTIAATWWLRSVTDTVNRFFFVDTDSYINNNYPANTYGVAPAFRILE